MNRIGLNCGKQGQAGLIRRNSAQASPLIHVKLLKKAGKQDAAHSMFNKGMAAWFLLDVEKRII